MILKNSRITYKLILGILLSTSLIFIITFSFYHRFSMKIIKKNVREHAESLTSEMVTKISKVIISIEKVPENMRYYLENSSYDKEKLKKLIRAVVHNNEELFGSAVAFEPYAFDKDLRYFAPYFYKVNGQIWSTYLDKFYDYFDWQWYKIPKELNHPVWSEPYYDKGGGNIIMETYSVPFYRTESYKKIFTGVVTADMSLEWLQEIVSSMKIFKTGYGFLISQKGTFITHPVKDYIMTETILSIAKKNNDEKLQQIGHKMIKREEGFVKIRDFYTGRESFLYYTPLLSQGWSLGIIIPYENLMEDINSLNKMIISLGIGGLSFLLLVIVIISTRITRPLRNLVKASQEISKGNLNVEIPQTKSNDEIGELTRAFSAMKSSLKEYIKELKETTASKERIESELKIAHEIQMSIVPRIFPPFPDRKEFDIYASVVPAREVGGDFYDFFFIDNEHFFFAIGDVSGKGVPASLFMAVTNTLIKKTANKDITPNEILTKVNSELCLENDACMFVTIFCGILNTRTGHVVYANAGHNPPLIIRQGQLPSFLKTKGEFVVGAIDDIVYSSNELTLSPGDVLFTYTDGVTEAMNETNELYSEKRLINFMSTLKLASVEHIVKSIMEDIYRFSQGIPQTDDITMMIFKFKGKADKK
jgi:sigma-B regulation protein RsbU (phosphoserine phosphatase)